MTVSLLANENTVREALREVIDPELGENLVDLGLIYGITIADASGTVVRTIKAPRNQGISRVWWNFRGDLTKPAKLRTSPEYAEWFKVPLEGRNAPTVGRMGVLQPPGTYTVKIAGTNESQQLVLRRDPNQLDAAEAGLTENVALERQIVADMDAAVTMVPATMGVSVLPAA